MASELDYGGLNLKHHKRSRRPKSGALKFDTRGARYLIVELPSSRVVTILVLSLLLACVIVSFPWSRSVLHRSMSSYRSVFDDPNNPEIVPVLFNDLANEGLLRTGNKALFLTEGDDAVAGLSSSVLRDIEMDLIHVKDLEHQSSIRQQSFDFVFTYGYEAASGFIDRALKTDGVLAVQLSQGPSEMFEVPNNYRIVYFRKFEFPVIAMKRVGGEQADVNGASHGQRRLMGISASEEEKKAALRNLEDVLLEPPRAASRRSSRYSKKTKYLPDLMGDRLALDKYKRRVFIDVATSEKEDPRAAGAGSGTEWFLKHYPTRNLEFEMHTVETVGEEDDQGVAVAQGQAEAAKDEGGMTEWLRANLREEEEEYVVMKAEAEVVEELVISRAIRLVDELFLDCKPRGRSRRAYWECLALYGRLRDEGVAVHQWWG